MSRAPEVDLPLPSARWRGRGGARRWYTVLVLALCVLLTPSVTDVVEDLLAFWTGVECCEDGGCGGKGGSFCAHPCTHCSCCAHPAALATAAGLVPLGEAPAGDALALCSHELMASGYRAPPYRPPAV